MGVAGDKVKLDGAGDETTPILLKSRPSINLTVSPLSRACSKSRLMRDVLRLAISCALRSSEATGCRPRGKAEGGGAGVRGPAPVCRKREARSEAT